MSDRWIAAAAVLTAAAARLALGVPLWVVVAAVLAAVLVRRPPLLCIALVLAAGWHGHRELSGLTPPASVSVSAWLTLVSDAEPGDFGTSADVRLGARRFVLRASGAPASELASATTGTRLRVRGRLGPLAHRTASSVSRHLAGVVVVASITARERGSWPWILADRVRATLDRGAASVGRETQSLFDGLVLGDDRHQDDVARHRFRASGLSHLLVVSGENVAFVLVAAAPLLERMTTRWRFAATILVLLAFGTVVRWEPSVLRAIAMSAVAATAAVSGRHASGIRVVSVAVIGVVFIDPLIVWSMGFLLSVAATAGLVLLARPISRRLPGPRFAADALGVVLAAQIGAAPVLVAAFGVVPAMGLVANLVAVPAAGWVMVWGCTAGFIAGVVPPWAAGFIHLPTRLLAWWISTVARLAATPGLPQWGPVELGLVALGVVVVLAGARRPRVRSLAVPVVVVALFLGVRPPGAGTHPVGIGSRVLVGARGEVALVLGGRVRVAGTLDALAALHVASPDLVIVTSVGASHAASAIASELDDPRVVAADPTRLRGARRLVAGVISVGTLDLAVDVHGRGFMVRSLS